MFELVEILNRLNLSFIQLNRDNQSSFNNIMPFSSAQSDSLIFFNKPTENTITMIKHTGGISLMTIMTSFGIHVHESYIFLYMYINFYD